MPKIISDIPKIEPLLERFVKQADEGTNLKTADYAGKYRELILKVGFGMGIPARVPWMGFFSNPSDLPSDNFYPAVIYYKKSNILVVAYGIGEGCPKHPAWNLIGLKTISEVISVDFQYTPEKYGSSLLERCFIANEALDFSDVASAVDRVIENYKILCKIHHPWKQSSIDILRAKKYNKSV